MKKQLVLAGVSSSSGGSSAGRGSHLAAGRVSRWGLAFLLPLAAGEVVAQANVQLTTHPMSGNVFRLRELGDLLEPAAFDVSSEKELWQLTFDTSPTPTVISLLDTTLAFTSTFETPTSDGFAVFWVGGTHPALNGSFSVEVRASAKAGASVYEFDILVDNQTTHALHQVDFPRVTTASRRLMQGHASTAGEVVAAPRSQGVIVDDPIANLAGLLSAAGPGYHPGYWSMGWCAYYDDTDDDGPVLFFGTRDPRGFAKAFLFDTTESGSLGFRIQTWPEGNTVPGNDYDSTTTFSAVLGVVRGEWEGAAAEYRSWVASKDPTVPLAKRPAWMVHDDPARTYLEPLALRGTATIPDRPIPAAVKDMELMLTVDGRHAGDFAANSWKNDVDSQRLFFQTNNTVTTVYGWHAFSFDGLNPNPPYMPDYFPVKTDFGAATPPVGAWAPYIDLEIYDSRSVSWNSPSSSPALPGLAPGFTGSSLQWLLYEHNGTPVGEGHPFRYRPCCAATNAAGDRYTEALLRLLAGDAQQRGAVGLYLDETSAMWTKGCYNSAANHGHAMGGGSFHTDARRAMLISIADQMRQDEVDFHFQSEAPNEVYSDVIHIAHQFGQSDMYTGDAIGVYAAPLYAAVYHDYQHTSRVLGVSNNWVIDDLAGPPPAHHPLSLYSWDSRRVLGYASWFGDVPSGGSDLSGGSYQADIAVNHANTAYPEFANQADLLRRIVAVTKHPLTRTAYHEGRRMPDPSTTVARKSSVNMTVWIPWVQGSPDLPLCYSSAWEEESTGKFGLFFVNWTAATDPFPNAGTQTFNITLDVARMGIDLRSYNLSFVLPTGVVPAGTVDFTLLPNTITIPIVCGPLDCFYLAFD